MKSTLSKSIRGLMNSYPDSLRISEEFLFSGGSRFKMSSPVNVPVRKAITTNTIDLVEFF